MTTLREAVLLSAMGDLLSFRDDRQLRKLLGWYPEAKESGTNRLAALTGPKREPNGPT